MLTGYRLHDQRLAYSGGTDSMRTVKLELADAPNTTGVQDCTAVAIAHDYRGMYGRLTIADYLEPQPEEIYSMLGFWLLCQRLGVFFGKNESSIDGAFAAYKGKKIGWYAAYAQIPEKIRTVFDEEAWASFMSADQRSLEKKTVDGRAKIIRGLASKSASNEATEQLLEPIAIRYAKGVVDATDKTKFKTGLFGDISVQIPDKTFALTWVIDPGFEPIADNDNTTQIVEQAMARYRQNGLDEKQLVAAMGIGNNGNYLNNIFGTGAVYLLEGKQQAIAKEMATIHGFDDVQRQIVSDRMGIMAAYLNKLGAPKLTTRWSEYRGDFNGTLESWFSNRTGKQDELHKQLNELNEQLTVLESIPDMSGPATAIAQELRETISVNLDDRVITQEESGLLRILQGELRSALNDWRQTKESQRSDQKIIATINKVLSKNLQSSPQFFGATQTERFKKLRNAKQATLEQLQLLESLWSMVSLRSDGSEQINDRTVDMLARTYQRCGAPFIKELYERVQGRLRCGFAQRNDKNRFYISGFEKREGIVKLEYKPVTIVELANIIDSAGLFDYARKELVGSSVLRDVVELQKTAFAALLGSVAEEANFDASGISHLFNDRQKMLVDKGGAVKISKITMRLLSSLTFSELSGFAATLSREFFVVRAAVQATNGQQMVLGYTNNTNSGNSFRRYFVYTKDLKCQKATSAESNLMLTRKSYNYDSGDFKASSVPSSGLLSIRSSRYQIQFLEWLLGYNKKRRGTLRAGGAFSILERDAKLDWSGEHPKLSFYGKPRVFMSQPFTVVPPEKEPQSVTSARYMGVDIGEYGLAWVVIEAKEDRSMVIAKGFLSDGQHRALASRVRQLRERQTRATFSMPSTRVARLRESLTGSYRARLESISMKYNARLSFEYEVSVFETGGSRIAKIYDSIKRADVKDNSPQNKQAWGKATRDAHLWAYETTAAGTSQTCSKCKRWASRHLTDMATYKLRPHEVKGLSVAKLDNGKEVVCFAPKAQELNGRELKKAIYKAMRPNQDGAAMGLLGETERRTVNAAWRETRGNIALFICPFLDCHYASDADIQAAFNIALRGYIKDQYRDKKDIKLSAEFFYEITSNMQNEPVALG